MKRCGYVRGYCRGEGQCHLTPGPWPTPQDWERLRMSARECTMLTESAEVWQRRIHALRRRRDWQIGNPYARGGG